MLKHEFVTWFERVIAYRHRSMSMCTILPAVYFPIVELLGNLIDSQISTPEECISSATMTKIQQLFTDHFQHRDKKVRRIISSTCAQVFRSYRKIEVFRETKRICSGQDPDSHGLDPIVTQAMIAGTRGYRSDWKANSLIATDHKDSILEEMAHITQPPIEPYDTIFSVVNNDSFAAAGDLKLSQNLNPLVLNMANKLSIGGGVEGGSSAQEECLFRSSNYHLALYPYGTLVNDLSWHHGRHHYNTLIPEFGSYYSPQVQVFRNTLEDYTFVTTPFSVGCIAVAGYDLRRAWREAQESKTLKESDSVDSNLEKNNRYDLETNLRGLSGPDLFEAFVYFSKLKIRHILQVAITHGHDSLVLGAISCGAFTIPGRENEVTQSIARAYKEVFEEPCYVGRFKHVCFAVLGFGRQGIANYNCFKSTFEVH